MAEHKMLAVKLPSGLEIQAAQAAFQVRQEFIPPPPRIPREVPDEIAAPFAAFRPWEKRADGPDVEAIRAEITKAAAVLAANSVGLDPTNPDRDLDDDALFGADLPEGH